MKIAVDIDNTLIFTKPILSKDKRSIISYKVQGINYELVDKVNSLYGKGVFVILYTGRHWDKLDLTLSQLRKIKIKYHTLVMGKPTADYFVDDKAVTPDKFLKIFREVE